MGGRMKHIPLALALFAPAAMACEEHTSLLVVCGRYTVAAELPTPDGTRFITPRQFMLVPQLREYAAQADAELDDAQQYVWDITGALKEVLYFECPTSL